MKNTSGFMMGLSVLKNEILSLHQKKSMSQRPDRFPGEKRYYQMAKLAHEVK